MFVRNLKYTVKIFLKKLATTYCFLNFDKTSKVYPATHFIFRQQTMAGTQPKILKEQLVKACSH